VLTGAVVAVVGIVVVGVIAVLFVGWLTERREAAQAQAERDNVQRAVNPLYSDVIQNVHGRNVRITRLVELSFRDLFNAMLQANPERTREIISEVDHE